MREISHEITQKFLFFISICSSHATKRLQNNFITSFPNFERFKVLVIEGSFDLYDCRRRHPDPRSTADSNFSGIQKIFRFVFEVESSLDINDLKGRSSEFFYKAVNILGRVEDTLPFFFISIRAKSRSQLKKL